MMLRCLSHMAMTGTVLLLVLAFQPLTARADSVNPNASTTTVDYRLTSSTTLGVPSASSTTPQVVALVSPPGGVVPPTQSNGQQGSPLTVLPDSTGFATNQLIVALSNAPSSSGQSQQELGLDFFGTGLQAGGVLNFALSVNSALASDPPVLTSITPGVTITLDSSTNSTSSGSSGSGGTSSSGTTTGIVNNPEPLSVILWSAVLVGVVARNRMLSRRRVD